MQYAKAIVQVFATIISAAIVALTGDNTIDAVEWINIAITGVGALNVFAGPNVPGASITKFVLSFFSAVLVLLVNLIADGITVSEWLQLLIAGLSAAGVYAMPNRVSGTVAAPPRAA
ncbi:MAG TPA: hypothetical protein VD864_01070 [Nocardioides sp.]|nr:hypothetical protein [Nocardioides sp.]